ncbi:MAG: hypothetical protein WBG00_00705, partial [Thermoanaerobaculia bacterium]
TATSVRQQWFDWDDYEDEAIAYKRFAQVSHWVSIFRQPTRDNCRHTLSARRHWSISIPWSHKEELQRFLEDSL